jgi:hypothetical protein
MTPVRTRVAGRLARRHWFALVAVVVAGLVASGCFGGDPGGGGPPAPPPAPSGTDGGYDISWVQCGGSYPSNPAFGVVGVSNGSAFHDNSCVAAEYRWAAAAPYDVGFYFNTANPGTQSVHWTEPGPRDCSGASDDLGCVYNYGYNAARHAFEYTAAQTGVAAGKAWWLDIETVNTWSADVNSNMADIQGMLDYLNSQSGVTPGIYSSGSQWTQITGGAVLASTPVWVPYAQQRSQAPGFCDAAYSFTGGPVAMVQYPAGSFDGDYVC